MRQASDIFAAAQDHHRAGRLTEAEALYRRVLALEPAHADALHYLGAIEFQAGRLDTAVAAIERSVLLKPDEPAAHVNLGRVLRQLGRLAEAATAFRRALVLAPGRISALQGLSDTLGAQGLHADALEVAQEAAALEPENPQLHYSLGVEQQALSRPDLAEAAYRRAVDLAPGFAEALNNLGYLMLVRGDAAGAREQLRAAIASAPNSAVAHNNLGQALQELGKFDEALTCYRRAVELDASYAEARMNFGAALRGHGKRDEAETELRKAIALRPDLADSHYNLGVVLRDLGRLDEAGEALRRAIALAPDRAEFHATAGIVANDHGESAAAMAGCRHAVELRPDSVSLQRQLLATSLYDPAIGEEERWRLHRNFGGAMAVRGGQPAALQNDRNPERRLRIGYVSSDLKGHPVGRNLEPLLAARDRRNFEIVAYADDPHPDGTTHRLKGMVDSWNTVVGMPDDALAERIRGDRIDVLVVMAGHFDRNRLQLAARRSAPVQISLFDAATSGLPAMDYFIADRFMVPRGGPERFSERVVCLPSFYVHAPIKDAPAVGPPPFRANGHVTFGSFNNTAKVNDDVLRLWSRLLAAVPASRLHLHFKNWYLNASLRERILRVLDVDHARVSFDYRGLTYSQHLASYNAIDIALDTFPFSGSTTTFEALWMGVPVITLAGSNFMSRWTASMLRVLKFDDLVTDTPDRYAALAAALAADPVRLAALRLELRQRLAKSSLCDGALRARQLERWYRVLWRRWCRSP